MKDWIEINYPDLPEGRQRNYDQLRTAVQEAWESISIEYLVAIVNSMEERCQAVIDAKGGHIKF